MRKVTLFIIAAMLVAFSANAQKKLTYGIKGGLNVSNITNLESPSRYTEADRKISFYVGAFAEWRLASFFAVTPELIYSSQSVRITDRIDWTYVNSKKSFSYINIPVMAKLYPLKWLSVDMGPQIGLLVAAKTKSEFTNWMKEVENIRKKTTDSKSEMKTLDFSFGAGFTCNLGKHMFLQARYNLGLTEVFKDKSYLNDKKNSNRVTQFGLGYRF